MPKTTNPLRYPGAKRLLVPYIQNLLECNNLEGCTFYEPYAGSAAVGLELLKREIINRLVIVEKDVLLYSFWLCVFTCTDELCERINAVSVDINTWNELNPLREIVSPYDTDVLDLGLAGLFFNRTNFSGILNANPIGGLSQASEYKIDCRFNKPVLIELIRAMARLRDRIEIYWDDALNFMRNYQNNLFRVPSFVYFDPPYFVKGKQLYRHSYSVNDHRALANYVRGIHGFDWLISYDDDPFICGLYCETGAQYQPFHLDYSVAKETRSCGKELLISNLPLPPVALQRAGGQL